MLPTPHYHSSPNVYDPSEDTFLLLDALEQDTLKIQEMKPSIIMEMGSGSGIVSAFLAKIVGDGNSGT